MLISDFFDKTMLAKYNTAGPRYTSYPTAVSFHNDFTETDFSDAVLKICKTDGQSPKSLSLYLHIPFCHSLCYYCGCNKIVTRNQDKVDKYIEYLIKEINLRSQQFSQFVVDQIHFGGGTPSFLSKKQLAKILTAVKNAYRINQTIEQSIEIDPREIELSYINDLYALGFNRLSIGVQDVNKKVQEKINRVQSTKFVRDLIKHAREIGFSSINIDLIYGLPDQHKQSVTETLKQVKRMDPDRISLFSYAHMPQLFPAQRKIKDHWLPGSDEKFDLFRQCIKGLVDQGYEFIGMDHFAKPTDELSVAAKSRSLGRNFQGYTSDQSPCLLGFGVSSISNLQNAYSQNVKKPSEYYRAIDALTSETAAQTHSKCVSISDSTRNISGDKQEFPLIEKGLSLSHQDEIHRALIHQLMCNFYVDKLDFGKRYNIAFDKYFENSLQGLHSFEEDKLLSNDQFEIKIHPRGRLLVRNICMNFDAYLKTPLHQLRYSRVI